MILFSKNNEDNFSKIRQITSRALGDLALYSSLYVFTAHSSRPAEVYLSPSMLQAEQVAAFLRQKLKIDVAVEKLGNPPQNNWIAFNIKFREKDPITCSKICLLLDRHINHLITW